MILPFLLLWIVLILLFKYQLKQNNETALIRATLCTLIAYTIIDCGYKEGLELTLPTEDDIQSSTLTLNFNKKYKKNAKKACKQVKKNTQVMTNNFNQLLTKVPQAPTLVNSNLKKNPTDVLSTYNNDIFNPIQTNLNDLVTLNSLYSKCKK